MRNTDVDPTGWHGQKWDRVELRGRRTYPLIASASDESFENHRLLDNCDGCQQSRNGVKNQTWTKTHPESRLEWYIGANPAGKLMHGCRKRKSVYGTCGMQRKERRGRREWCVRVCCVHLSRPTQNLYPEASLGGQSRDIWRP